VINAAPPLCEQGQIETAQALLQTEEWQRDSEQGDHVMNYAQVEARLLRAQGRPEEALAAARRGLSLRQRFSTTNSFVKRCFVEALEAACDLGDLRTADELLALIENLKPGQSTPFLTAQHARFRARIDAHRDEHEHVDDDYQTAEQIFAQHGLVFYRAATELEHAEWLLAQQSSGEARPLLDHARETFEQLEAKPWLERLAAAEATVSAEIPA
jgi:ATP/maltotriose-dependent transcriptional regulator MalT